MNVGFAGLGQMGRPMAERLLGAGNALKVWNRSPAAAAALREKGAAVASAPADLLDCDVVVTMLADDAAVESVWLGSGAAQRMPRGAVHLNMATVSMAMTRKLVAVHEKNGSFYVAAPVFGRPGVAAQGQLDVIAAGPAAAIERCQPLLKAMAKQVFAVGAEPEKATAVKIARNFLLAVAIESLGEAFALVRKCGVDATAFHDIITGTSLNSPVVRNYAGLIVKQAWQPPQFSMMLGLKDIQLALDAAAEAGVPMPTAELIRRGIQEAIAAGRGGDDAVSLAGHIARKAGL
jgi:3-hydroxyisobutyrate dehydrogenase-like beta-hydroxyacid dehydrogenase